jgi:Zn-dependent M28 family amino/carboxypeptidase
MKTTHRPVRRPLLILAAASLSVWSACGPGGQGSTAAPAGTGNVAPLAVKAMPAVDGNAVLEHVKVLASDEYEGRGPGTKGEDLTVAYLEGQFKEAGLSPGNTDGTYIQKVPLVGITPDPSAALMFKRGRTTQRLRYRDDFVAWTKHVAETASLTDSELIFVGYGVVAPEYGWDDFKGVDVKGKTLLILVNDPPVAAGDDPARLDPKVFGGVAMTYYGRWTYKFEEAARQGAAGAIIVHETGPAGYPFAVLQGSAGERFDLVTPDKNMGRASVEAWITLDKATAMLKLAGHDFEALKKQAVGRDFRPVPLGVTASIALENTLRTIDSRNVVAKLEGSDPVLKDEYVIYTAHWDHLGIGGEVNGDRIYNGAVDNATGTGGLIEMARAFKKLPRPPKRSILFLAVTAEEQGLLGSQYYAVTPIYPLSKTLANINMDGLNVYGRTTDVTIVGFGNSELDDYAANAAAEQGRTLRPDAEPEKGFYYRSDHFNFAKEGVPALDPDEGTEFVGRTPDFAKKVRDDYTTLYYHKPQDEIRPDWDMSGVAEDLQLLLAVGYRVAEADRYPEWKPGTEFKAKRDAQLRGGTN